MAQIKSSRNVSYLMYPKIAWGIDATVICFPTEEAGVKRSQVCSSPLEAVCEWQSLH